jgi:hypothetical protein
VFGNQLGDPAVVAAGEQLDGLLVIDRLLHHATVLQIDGDSDRMRGHRARLAQLRNALNQPKQGGEFP